MSYKQLIDLVTASPGRYAARNAFATLCLLARDGDFSAELAIGTVLAREFRLVGQEYVIEADSPEQLLSRDNIPAIARLRILGSYPRIIFGSPEVAGRISRECWDASLFQRFQWLVSHDALIQDEALKAFLLVIIMGGGNFGREDLAASPGGFTALFQEIANSAKVVPGDNADTLFEVGRDLILHGGIMGGGFVGLTFAIDHEIGHYIVGSDSGELMMDPGFVGLNALADVLPGLFSSARERAVSTSDSPGPCRLKLDSGVVVLCSMQQLGDETATHLSFSLDGAPIDLQWASQAALLALRTYGIDPQHAAVAYSNNGFLHVGSFDAPQLSSEWAAPKVRQAQLRELSKDAASWIDKMKKTSRFLRSEKEILYSLRAGALPTRLYAPYEASRDEAALCRQLRPGMDPGILPTGSGPALISAALRCTDAEALRWVLGTGHQHDQAGGNDQRAGLDQLGLNCGVIRDGDESKCYGATAKGALTIIGELHDAGFDINEPIYEDNSTLLIEAAGRHAELVRFLLAHGADPGACDYAGRTALIEATAMGNVEAVEDLLRSGSDPDAATDLGRTPIHFVTDVWDADSRVRIVDALANAGATIDEETNDGLTALMMAAASAYPETAARLIAHGADVNARSPDGRTPLTLVGEAHAPFTSGGLDGRVRDELSDARKNETIQVLLDAGAARDG